MGLFDKMKQAASAAGGNQTVTFTFQELPESLAQMQALPEASLDTTFKTAALTVCALCAYGADKNIGKEMPNWLRGPRPLNGQEISFLNDRFRDGKSYIPFSCLVGASPENGYTPRQPFTLLVGSDHTSNTEEGCCKLFIPCGGADDPRPIKLRRKGSSTAASGADSAEPEQLAAMRQLAGENGDLAGVLYLGSVPERTTDVQQVLDSQTDLRELWVFVYDIPEDHYVVSPDGGRDLYCIFPQDPQATLFVYEVSLTDDAEHPLQRGKQLYYSEDGQPILLLCNISDIAPQHRGGAVPQHRRRAGVQPLPFRRERPCCAGRRRVRFHHLPGWGRLGDRHQPVVAGGQLAGDRPRHRRGLF